MTALYPYNIGRFIYVPDSKPFTFHVLLKRESLTAVGVLEKITGVFANFDVPILELKISVLGLDQPLKVVLIADLKGKEDIIDKIALTLKRQPFVEELQFMPPVAQNLAIDLFSFPVISSGERAIVMRRPVYEGLIKGGWEVFGTPYAILLYSVGYQSGLRAYREHAKLAEEPDTLKLATGLFQLFGYGRVEVTRLDDKARIGVLRVYDSFECQMFQGAGEIRGNFVRGVIAGWFAGHWSVSEDEEVFAREVKCIAEGDAFCEYIVQVEKKKH